MPQYVKVCPCFVALQSRDGDVAIAAVGSDCFGARDRGQISGGNLYEICEELEFGVLLASDGAVLQNGLSISRISGQTGSNTLAALTHGTVIVGGVAAGVTDVPPICSPEYLHVREYGRTGRAPEKDTVPYRR